MVADGKLRFFQSTKQMVNSHEIPPKRRGPRSVSEGSLTTREELLRAAHDLMIETDSIDISLSELSKKGQLSPALVKYYFGNKDGMLFALLEQQRPPSGILEQLLARDVPAIEKLKIHIRGVVSAYARTPYLNRLILTLLGKASPLSDKISEQYIKPMAEFHAKLLAQGVADGSIRSVDPMSLNFILVGACDNLFSRRAALPVAFGIDGIDENVKRRHTEQIIDVLLYGVSTQHLEPSGR